MALGEVSDEMCELARETVRTDGTALDRVFRYLDVSRDGLKGCRMGRFAAEMSIAEPALRKPIERYFRELQNILAGALREAQADGAFAKCFDASELALMLITVVQGGFVVSRVYRDGTHQSGHGNCQVAAQIASTSLRRTRQCSLIRAAPF